MDGYSPGVDNTHEMEHSPEIRRQNFQKREISRLKEKGINWIKGFMILCSTLVASTAFEARADTVPSDGQLVQTLSLADIHMPVTAMGPHTLDEWLDIQLGESFAADVAKGVDDPDNNENIPRGFIEPVNLGKMSVSFPVGENVSLAVGGPKFAELAEGNFGGKVLFTLNLPKSFL